MDPQQRLLLELGYAALHGAWHRRVTLMGGDGGVFLGIERPDWAVAQPPPARVASLQLSSRTELPTGYVLKRRHYQWRIPIHPFVHRGAELTGEERTTMQWHHDVLELAPYAPVDSSVGDFPDMWQDWSELHSRPNISCDFCLQL